MVMGLDNLPGTFMFFEECFYGRSGLIVRYIENGFVSLHCEVIENCFERIDDVLAGA